MLQAGCTPLERLSFGAHVLANGRVDGLRHLHPTGTGIFSYWSIRAGNRLLNRGLRLDYTIVSKSLIELESAGPKLVDAFVLDCEDTIPAFSDHAPVGAVISLT